MKSIGSTLLFFGIGSIVLHFINMEFILLAWIELWGATVAWIIRAALIVVGAILWIVGKSREAEA